MARSLVAILIGSMSLAGIDAGFASDGAASSGAVDTRRPLPARWKGSQSAPGPGIVQSFEMDDGFSPANRVDELVLAAMGAGGIAPAYLCSDEVFVRRVYLDVIGTLPGSTEVDAFLRDRDPDKRAALIEALLLREEFADYWSLKWCDVLRVKSEFPINLWPNAAQAYHRWIREAVRGNMPYDQFARELLTASGSNFRIPPVNFYRAVQGREPLAIAEAVALTFMGVRLDNLPDDARANISAFFSRVAYKQTAEWKEEIIHLDPAPAEPLEAVFFEGGTIRIMPGQDPRAVFADWLIAPDNAWFARNAVNRVWAWLLGRGIIHEPDDIRPDNPAVHPEVLAFLERELVTAGYDLRHIYRLILNSRTYQQSFIPRCTHADAEVLFAHYGVRQLDAEVLIDALRSLFGGVERYSSEIPEPFTFIPDHHPTIALADGSITSGFLEMFGRPARDTGLESERNNQPTAAQRMHLLNSSHIQRMIEQSDQMRRLTGASRGNTTRVIRRLYLNILSRYPTEDELSIAEEYFRTSRLRLNQAANDLAWALINTKEFLYRH